MRPSTLADLLPAAAARFGNRPSLIVRDQRHGLDELDVEAGRFAAYLHAIGLVPGDRVTLWAPNGFNWAIVYYGALRAGMVINPLNYLLAADEVAHAVEDCGARLLVAGASKISSVESLPGRGQLATLMSIQAPQSQLTTCPELRRTIAALAPSSPVAVVPDSLAAILYTSGTTGRPKGAMLSHRSLLLNAALTAQMHGRSSGDVVVTALPLPHVYGAAILNAAVLTGMTMVLHEQFREADILGDIVRHRATMFEGVPTMYHYLMAFPQLGDYDVSSLTRCTVGGQTMPHAKMEEVERRLGCPLIELWGMTELGGLGTTHAQLAASRLGSIGVALPHMEVRIAAIDANSPEPLRGEVGELCIRGPLVMQGYFGDETATREAIDADEWLHTGDLARQDADSYLYVVDRKKDMILTAGYNVYPAELERVVAMHPAVAMVAVGAVPDAAKGEVVKAYVVLRPNVTATADEIVAHCREHLAAYKIPRQVQFVNDLPKTSTGKVLRRALRTLGTPAIVPE